MIASAFDKVFSFIFGIVFLIIFTYSIEAAEVVRLPLARQVRCIYINNEDIWVGTTDRAIKFHQDTNKVLEVLGEENGLSSNWVNAIAVDDNNFVWFGTKSGLAKYQNGSLTVHNVWNSELPSNWINDILVSQDGSIWCATASGVVRYLNGNWQVFTVRNSNIPGDFIIAMSADSENNIWIVTSHGGIAKYANSKWEVFQKESLTSSKMAMRDISIARDGKVYLATAGGLLIFQNGKFTEIVNNDCIKKDGLYSSFADESGDMWFGANNIITRLRDDNNWLCFNEKDLEFHQGTINCLALDSESNIWIGTPRGLSKITLSAQESMRLEQK